MTSQTLNRPLEYLPRPPKSPQIRASVRQWVVAGLLIFGVQLSLVCTSNFYFTNPHEQQLLLAVLLLALIPPIARPIARWINAARDLSPRTRRMVAGLIFFAAAGLLFDSVVIQKRYLLPQYHDEFSYILQA